MSNNDGDGDYLPIGEFNLYKENQQSLCNSYRNHIETKIVLMEESIVGKIKMFGVTLSIIVTVLTLINVYLSIIGG